MTHYEGIAFVILTQSAHLGWANPNESAPKPRLGRPITKYQTPTEMTMYTFRMTMYTFRMTLYTFLG